MGSGFERMDISWIFLLASIPYFSGSRILCWHWNHSLPTLDSPGVLLVKRPYFPQQRWTPAPSQASQSSLFLIQGGSTDPCYLDTRTVLTFVLCKDSIRLFLHSVMSFQSFTPLLICPSL
jgi:hypothetical protein